MLLHLTVAKLVSLGNEPVQKIPVVRHHQHRSFKIGQGLLEQFLGANVEVIGRLIENEEIHRLQQQQHHGESCPLPATEHRHLFIYRLATKQKSPQQIAYFGANIAHSHLVHSIQHSQVVVELIGLVLGKIPDFNLMPQFQFSAVLQLVKNHTGHGGLALSVFTHKSHLVAPLNHKIHVAEHQMIAVALTQSLPLNGNGPAVGSGWKLDAKGTVVELIDFDAVVFFELFDARLYLNGLGGLVTEAFDEGFGIFNFLLLIAIGRKLLLAALLAQFYKTGIGRFIIVQLPQRQFGGAIGNVVQKGPVVRNQHEGPGIVAQVILEPLNGFNIEVVGGFIEQKHVGLAQQYLGQLNAHAPATAELRSEPLKIAALKTQSLQRLLHLRVVIMSPQHIVALGQVGQLLNGFQVVVGLVIIAFGHFVGESFDAAFHSNELREGRFGLLPHRLCVVVLEVLGQITQGECLRQRNSACRGLKLTGYDFEQGRFSGTVFSHQTNAVAGIDQKRYLIEQTKAPKIDSELVD